jgi:hypothetical protein
MYQSQNRSWGKLSQYSAWPQTGRREFDPRQRQIIFPLACVQPGSEAHTASYPMATGGKGQPGRDADHAPSLSAEVKNDAIYPLPLDAWMAVAGQLYLIT